MLKDKKYYVDVYNKMVDDYLDNYKKENGNLNNADSMTYIETAEEIIGYYISTYNNEALNVWLENLKYSPVRYTDEEVTKVLTELCQ